MFGREFLVKTVRDNIEFIYMNHSTYHEGDSGLDLFIVEDTKIAPGETVLVDLGVQCQSRSFSWCFWNWYKNGFYNYHSYFLIPRSSISKTPLLMRNSIGLIDSAYTGNLKAPLYNTSDTEFNLNKGQRFVQLVNGDLSNVKFSLTNTLRDTSRGSNGFGSTGV